MIAEIMDPGQHMNPQFIHLRIHTEYSLCNGLTQIQPLIEKTADDQMPALAITDQSNLFAAIKFYQEALSAGVKPIIGADVWLENKKQPAHPYRLTLLCQNDLGYKNLLVLISKSYQEGQAHNKAIIKQEWLHRIIRRIDCIIWRTRRRYRKGITGR